MIGDFFVDAIEATANLLQLLRQQAMRQQDGKAPDLDELILQRQRLDNRCKALEGEIYSKAITLGMAEARPEWNRTC